MVKERPLYRKNARLLATMIARGYTMKTLAAAAGVHYLTIWRIVNRQHRPNTATAKRLSELLESSPRQLGLEVYGGKRHDPPPA